MKLQQALQDHVFFTTRQMSFILKRGLDSTSRTLKQMSKQGVIEQLTRGIWAQPQHPHFTPFGAVPYLLGNEQGYVSFLSALHRHGVISQIPQVIQVATTGHTRKLKTVIGSYNFIQIQPSMMRDGVKSFEGKMNYLMATPEKALLDALYVSTRRGRRFSSFPELDLSDFDKKEFLRLLNEQVRYPLIQKKIRTTWERLSWKGPSRSVQVKPGVLRKVLDDLRKDKI